MLKLLLIRSGRGGTFVCSGSTHGPSIISVCIRCDWSIGGVQDRYLRYENAGDQFLGRVVAGLPMDKPEFAILPPHFLNDHDEDVQHLMSVLFKKLLNKPHLYPVLSLCLASLVFHSDWLIENLPKKHPLFTCDLFREKDILKNYSSAPDRYISNTTSAR